MSIFHLKPLRQQTDEQLMARAAADSDTAFEELYRRYARRLKGFFFMQLGGDEELALSGCSHCNSLTRYPVRTLYARIPASFGALLLGSDGFIRKMDR